MTAKVGVHSIMKRLSRLTQQPPPKPVFLSLFFTLCGGSLFYTLHLFFRNPTAEMHDHTDKTEVRETKTDCLTLEGLTVHSLINKRKTKNTFLCFNKH